MKYNHEGIVIRPPSEAGSFLLQATLGCSHNQCAFCSTYKYTKFARRPLAKIKEDIDLAARYNPSIKRAFLCDGDAMCLETEELLDITSYLDDRFPKLERVGLYANARDLLAKSPDELRSLSENKLTIAYLGLESGNDEILKEMKKGATSEEMVQAVIKAQASGINVSAIGLLGLGSNSMSHRHAVDTGKVVSRMNPRYFSALTLMIVPGTPLHRKHSNGEFEVMNPLSILQELATLLRNIDVEGPCLFRTNHASNYLPIGGVLPRDKDKMLAIIDEALKDTSTLRPERFRAL
ncbi:MAG: radical SAM protein [Actinobacteria bacterium]|nr:radical SAM protein [Actinomycetota bacterium]